MLLARVFYEPIIPTLLECVLSFPVEQDMYHTALEHNGDKLERRPNHVGENSREPSRVAMSNRMVGGPESYCLIASSSKITRPRRTRHLDELSYCHTTVSSAYAPHVHGTITTTPGVVYMLLAEIRHVLPWKILVLVRVLKTSEIR